MFSHIKTSKENKDVVTQLTNKLNLGAENVISRIALVYSLSKDKILKIEDIHNSSGKEYSKSVLFGQNSNYYLGMVALHYGIHITDKDLPKYIKMHIDDGLQLLNEELNQKSNIDSFDFLVEKIEGGLNKINQ